jgi:high mobility group protein B1
LWKKKVDPKKPKGKMSSCVFFMQTCQEEHKKHPDASVNSESSKKCSERWKTMFAKEKGKFEDMAKADKARYEREMKNYISLPSPKGVTKKEVQGPSASKRPSPCSVLSTAPKSKASILGYPLVMLQRH